MYNIYIDRYMCDLKYMYIDKKTHNLLKSQVFLFFSETLAM